MTILGDLLSTLFERRLTPYAYSEKADGPIEELCHELLSQKGNILGLTIAGKILASYDQMSDPKKIAFFNFLVTEMDINIDEIQARLSAYDVDRSRDNLTKYLSSSETKRRELFRRLNQDASATGRLVAMREDLMRLAKSKPELQTVDLDFQQLFRSWFNNGFLVLRPISWASPADILEKIIAYEAVHAIDTWEELRRRLEPSDRRCFAYFHPSMPDEPLIFVEVALMEVVPNSIQSVLAETRDIIPFESAKTAVFYSISNCQKGLAGISFGNALIKNVAAELAREIPNIKTFVTLSPMPKFASSASEEGHNGDQISEENLRKLAAKYLINAKQPDGMPVDPVARFHLNNGALVHAVHTSADTSPQGQKQSFGVMVNYAYELKNASKNHENFAANANIAAAKTVKALAKSKLALNEK